MLYLRGNRLMALLDRLRIIHLLGAVVALTLGFAVGYRMLSKDSFSANGLRLPDSRLKDKVTIWDTLYLRVIKDPFSANGLRLPAPKPRDQVTIWDALYFSVITETTLGYGDIRPVGWSRLLACCQVVLGLTLAGLVVAKITSMQGRELRMVERRASGDWIEPMRLPNGTVIVSFARIVFSETVIRYDGESYWETAEPAGFWRGEMIGLSGPCLRFDYSNRESHALGDSFSEGVATLQFTADNHGRTWVRYVASAHDFGTRETLTWEGTRASQEESEIIHGTDDLARAELIGRYAKRVAYSRRTGPGGGWEICGIVG